MEQLTEALTVDVDRAMQKWRNETNFWMIRNSTLRQLIVDKCNQHQQLNYLLGGGCNAVVICNDNIRDSLTQDQPLDGLIYTWEECQEKTGTDLLVYGNCWSCGAAGPVYTNCERHPFENFWKFVPWIPRQEDACGIIDPFVIAKFMSQEMRTIMAPEEW